MFKPIETSNFAQSEAEILKFWKDNKIFEQSIEHRKGEKPWVFYEGPPTANGMPHPGHVLTRVMKDLFCRYKSMTGHYVLRKAGWDTHGLPVEIEVEKMLKLDGKADIEKYGVEKFVRKCIESVWKYTFEWERLTDRIGYWVDLENPYVTYHQSYIESVWWSLKELHSKGLLYKGHKVLPFCPHCQTALSSHEVGQGYKEVDSPSVFLLFRTAPKTSFVVWTTTPWTLPSNSGLAINPEAEYSHVKHGEETLIMASALVKQVMGKLEYEVIKTEIGKELVGQKYKPVFNWVNLTDAEKEKGFKVCAADFVALDTGSGIVHLAPAFGADDYEVGCKEGLPFIQIVGPDGRFNVEGAFNKQTIKEAEIDILKNLRDRGLLLKKETIKHEYPFCWRCNTALIYYARSAWFIKTTEKIKRIISNNCLTNWHPEHIKDGRFGSFLAGNIDWALSRERYWGTPLNLWICEHCGTQKAIGSYAELSQQFGLKGLGEFFAAKQEDPSLDDNLIVHKPWIDAVTFSCSCGGDMKRTPEVIDCWYDSGAMPFAQWGFPHLEGSKEKFLSQFPADFISEAIDQTRGWFYSLMAENTMLKESFEHVCDKKKDEVPFIESPVPFKNCLVLGHVCDEKGEKMAKAKGNYLDPNLILDEEGADALRWFFYSSTNPWTSMRFSKPAVREAQKDFLIKLRNVYSFFSIYANIDKYQGPYSTHNFDCWKTELDRWVKSEMAITILSVRQKLDAFDVFGASQALSSFVDSLSNWYVRRSRNRFWRAWENKEDSIADKEKWSAYCTLHDCLLTTAQLAAPFTPFLAENLWQNLKPCGKKSVHLTDYPAPLGEDIDLKLSDEIIQVRKIVSIGHSARSTIKIKTRQPLSKAILFFNDAKMADIVNAHKTIIMEELNVKEIEIGIDPNKYVEFEFKPNFKLLGSKYRGLVPAIGQAIGKADPMHIHKELAQGKINLSLGKDEIVLLPDEIQMSMKARSGYAASGDQNIVVVLDPTLTQELIEEGVAREFVNSINSWRGELNLPYEQRIKLAIRGNPKLEEIVRKHAEYICNETLALQDMSIGTIPEWKTRYVKIDEEVIEVGIFV